MSPEKLSSDMWGLFPRECIVEDVTGRKITGPALVRVTVFDPADYPGIDKSGFIQARELVEGTMIVLTGTDFAARVQRTEATQG